VLPSVEVSHTTALPEWAFQILVSLLTLIGIYLAYMAIIKAPKWIEKLKASEAGVALHQLWYSGWGFDWVYDHLFVRPFVYWPL
jgi:NADH-quinone oxidoreductase subunit L